MGSQIHSTGFRLVNRLRTPSISQGITNTGLIPRFTSFSDVDFYSGKSYLLSIIFKDLSLFFLQYGFFLNSIEFSIPGKRAILVCELFPVNISPTSLKNSTICASLLCKLKPFVGNR